MRARPVSRELPVDPYRDLRWGFPCCLWSPMRTCRRHYPGRFNGACSLVCLHCQRPSPCNSKVGSCNYFFRGLLSVHSRYGLHARGVAKRPFTPKAPTAPLPRLPLRLLPGGANQFPGGSCTRWSPAPFTAHCFAIDCLAKGCCETPNFENWWFEPVFSRRMVLEGVGFGLAGVTAGPATRQDRDRSRWPNFPAAGWTRIDHGQRTAEDQRLPRSSARRRLHVSGNRNCERIGGGLSPSIELWSQADNR